MKKMTKLTGVAVAAFLLTGCQSSESDSTDQGVEPVGEESSNENTSDDDKEIGETEENNSVNSSNEETPENDEEDNGKEDMEKESSNRTSDNDSDVYDETQVTPYYYIDSHMYDAQTAFLTAFYIRREGDQKISLADRLKSSLIENDPSEQVILESFSDISVDWPTLHVNFNAEANQLSTTSAQTTLFYDSLFGISDLYGIEEIVFSNPDGERNITVAQRLVDKPIVIKDERERGLSRGYYTIYDKDLAQTLFLSGGDLEEPIANEDGQPLSFSETVEAMATVENSDAFYSSAIIEGLEVAGASLENGVATVQYTMDEDAVSAADRIVFENAMQLAALDFHAREIRLVNDTLQEIVTYPLIGQ